MRVEKFPLPPLLAILNGQSYKLHDAPSLPDGGTWYWSIARQLFINLRDSRVIALYPQNDGHVQACLLPEPADPTMRA